MLKVFCIELEVPVLVCHIVTYAVTVCLEMHGIAYFAWLAMVDEIRCIILFVWFGLVDSELYNLVGMTLLVSDLYILLGFAS